jgi:hypothetical protein
MYRLHRLLAFVCILLLLVGWTIAFCFPTTVRARQIAPLSLFSAENHHSFEDDDERVVSHPHKLFMANNNNNQTMTTTVEKAVYQRVEDWHAATHSPTHTIEHLKREKALWSKKFESLQ